jgi:hypothetical protein
LGYITPEDQSNNIIPNPRNKTPKLIFPDSPNIMDAKKTVAKENIPEKMLAVLFHPIGMYK